MPTLLVALDFDGVLAPIVQDPSTSRPLPGSATAVRGLADLPATTVAMLSGRALHDLRTVSGFATPVRLVGSHGGEFDDGALELTDAQRALKDELAAAVRGVVDGEPGVRLESKPAGIVVHVRGADPAVAERVLDAVRPGRRSCRASSRRRARPCWRWRWCRSARVRRSTRCARAWALTRCCSSATTSRTRRRSPGCGRGTSGVKVGEGETAAEYRVSAPEDVTERAGGPARGALPLTRIPTALRTSAARRGGRSSCGRPAVRSAA